MSTRMQAFERETWNSVWNSKRVWLTHVIVNAVLMLAVFYWLRIHDKNTVMFSVSVVAGLLIAFVTLTLHGATFDLFRQSPRVFRSSLARAAKHAFSLLIWVAIFGVVLWLITQLWDYDEQIGGWARHALPSFLRGHISPRSVISAATGLVGFLCFFVWPILWLPFGSQIATRGFRGFFTLASLRPIRELRFWGLYVVCFALGGYVSYKLAWMTPKTSSSLSAQTWSMVLRLGIAYLLLITAWIIVCAAIARASDGEVAVESAKPEPVAVAPA